MKGLSVKKGQAFLVENRENRYYFSGTDIAEGYLIVSDEPVYFTDMRYFVAAKEKLGASGVKCSPYFSDDDIVKELKRQGVKTLFIDYETTTVRRYEKIKTFCDEVKDGAAAILNAREVKTEEELACIVKACDVIEKAVADAFRAVKEGVTETEIREVIVNKIAEYGGEGESFDTIVAFGANSAVPHHETGDTRLTKNSAVLIDTGAKIKGYCSDITRTAFFGTPTEEFVKAYNAVLSANALAEEKIFSGISGVAADKIARDYLNEQGFGEYFTHSLGHGVGLLIHEKPYLSPKSTDVLTENKVFTIEPGVYLEGKFGIRIEDTCVMRGGKAKRLYGDDKALKIIG